MDCIVLGDAKSRRRLSDFHFQEDLGASRVALVVKIPCTNAGDVRHSGSIP